ncbi:uncharacterized protein LOC102801753 [Saccoglossus kowalevskii]
MDLAIAFLGDSMRAMVPMAQMGAIGLGAMMSWIAMWILIIGIASTGPTRRWCCGRYGCRLYGRIIVGTLIVTCYFMAFIWMLLIGVLMIPTVFTFIIDQVCAVEIVKLIKEICVDTSSIIELLGLGLALALNTLTKIIAVRSIQDATDTVTGLLTDATGMINQVTESIKSRSERYEIEGVAICMDELYNVCEYGTGLWLGFGIACGSAMFMVFGFFYSIPVLTANYAHIHDTPDRKKKKKKRKKVKHYSRELKPKTTEERYVIVEDMQGKQKAVPEKDYAETTGLEVLEKYREYPEYRYWDYPRFSEKDYPPFVPLRCVVEFDDGETISSVSDNASYYTSVENVPRGGYYSDSIDSDDDIPGIQV